MSEFTHIISVKAEFEAQGLLSPAGIVPTWFFDECFPSKFHHLFSLAFQKQINSSICQKGWFSQLAPVTHPCDPGLLLLPPKEVFSTGPD